MSIPPLSYYSTHLSPIKNLEETKNKTSIDLDSIRQVYGDIKEIRMLLKGNKELCVELFKKAIDVGDAISQIQLSHAYKGMILGNDDSIDFSSLIVTDLNDFVYFPEDFFNFSLIYKEAMGEKSCFNKTFETFQIAANSGYLPAVLEIKYSEWGVNHDSYGFAVQLCPFVDKGCALLDKFFAIALKVGSRPGSKGFYEGLVRLKQLSSLEVRSPTEGQCFNSFRLEMTKNTKDRSNINHDGFVFVENTIVLTPSPEAWEVYVKEKLNQIEFSPPHSHQMPFDQVLLKSLIDEYKLTAGYSRSKEGNTKNDSIFLYLDHKLIGEIVVSFSAQTNIAFLSKTLKNEKIQPVIDFIEEVLIRSNINSTLAWLGQLQHTKRKFPISAPVASSPFFA